MVMKLTVLLSFALVVAVLIFCYIRTGRYHLPIVTSLKKMILAAIVTVLSASLMLIEISEIFGLFTYALYFACTDWLVYFVLCYIVDYSNEVIDDNINRRGMKIILTLDSLFLMSNIFTQAVFTVHKITIAQGFDFYRFDSQSLFFLHGFVIYAEVLFCFITLVYQFFKLPVLYRVKLFWVFFLLSGIVIINSICMFYTQTFDWSVFAYAIAGILFHYFSLIYTPKLLTKKTLSLVVDDMTDGLIILDQTGLCVYTNNSAQKKLNLYPGLIHEQDTPFRDWLDLHEKPDFSSKESDDPSCVPITRYGDSSLKIIFHRLEDSKKYFLGSFFTISDITEEQKKLELEHYRATRQPLTKIYNRDYFFEKAKKMLQKHPDTPYYMMCSDIGKFKLVNDLFGEKIGDELLVGIAKTLLSLAKEGSVYGHMGSDRFALLIPKERFTEELFLSYGQRVATIKDDITYPLFIYFGVYKITNINMPVSTMYDRAYMALSTIKGSYQNLIAYYDDIIRRDVLKEQTIISEIDRALNNGEIHMYLQPQVTMDGSVIGAEALARWIHPEKGLLHPGEFIPILEKTGLIYKLDLKIWEIACQQLQTWKKQGIDFHISVNISPKDFYFMDIYKVFTELVEKYEISPSKLNLEITETAVMSDPSELERLIKKLQNYGFKIEMDDFGSGYSSLNMLKNLCVNVIKIDMGFLSQSEHKERSRVILKNIIALSKELQMDVITEGVETEEQLQFLDNIGCSLFQGFYFSKPMDINSFEKRYL